MSTQTYNFDVPFQELSGEATKQTLGKILAQILSTETKPNVNVRKVFDWSRALEAGAPLTIDRTDRKALAELIENNERVMVLVKGQLLEVLEKEETTAPDA